MNLAQLQQTFRRWLVSASDESAQALGNHHAGLAVYQNNYRAQLVGCLEQAFPYLRRWVGEEAFLAVSITHIDRHPPHAWTLDAYPEGFYATLKEMFPGNPDVHELAWIESARVPLSHRGSSMLSKAWRSLSPQVSRTMRK